MSTKSEGKKPATAEEDPRTMNTMAVKTAEFDAKLSGPAIYPEWSTDLQTYFELIDGTEEYVICGTV